MDTLLIGLIVLMSVAILLLAGAFFTLATAVGKIGRLSESISELTSTINDEVVPTAREARNALAGVNDLTGKLGETADRINRVAADVERVLEGSYVAEVAGKAIKSSASGLLSVYEGLKQGIRTLRESKESVKGGSSDG